MSSKHWEKYVLPRRRQLFHSRPNLNFWHHVERWMTQFRIPYNWFLYSGTCEDITGNVGHARHSYSFWLYACAVPSYRNSNWTLLSKMNIDVCSTTLILNNHLLSPTELCGTYLNPWPLTLNVRYTLHTFMHVILLTMPLNTLLKNYLNSLWTPLLQWALPSRSAKRTQKIFLSLASQFAPTFPEDTGNK